MKLRAVVLSTMFVLTACAPAGPTDAQLRETAQVLADAMLQTQAAVPTQTPLPTNTPEPSPTALPSDTPEPTLTATTVAQSLGGEAYITTTPFGYLPPNQMASAQADKLDRNAPLVLVNTTEFEIRLHLVSPVYQEYVFTRNMTLIVPQGEYTYQAWIDGQGPRNGSFRITNGDKHELIFRQNQINFSSP